MKKLLVTFMLLSSVVAIAGELSICTGEYALCAASATTPTNKMITVNGKKYKEGMAVCPVLKGDSVADLNLMNGSCAAPAGKVWSLFSPQSSYPQAPSWAVAPAVFRSFVTTDSPGGGMSNMWSFLCDIQPKQVNGVTLANCYGPINESPWNDRHVPVGVTAFTQAPVGAENPVGGNMPILPAKVKK